MFTREINNSIEKAKVYQARLKGGPDVPAQLIAGTLIYPYHKYQQKDGTIFESVEWFPVLIKPSDFEYAKELYCHVADIISSEELAEIQNNKFINSIKEEVEDCSLECLETKLPEKDQKWRQAALMILADMKQDRNTKIKIELIEKSDGKQLKSAERYTVEEHMNFLNEFLNCPLELFEFKLSKGEIDQYLDLALMMLKGRKQNKDTKLRIQLIEERKGKSN